MKIRKKDIAGCFVVFAGVILASWLFLILSASIPNAKLQDNMIKSALTYAQEDAFSHRDGRKMNGVADNYADSIWLNVAWYMGKGNPIMSTMQTLYYDGEEYGENIGLYLAVSDEGTQPNTDYTRYWHGTAGFIRILHLFTDVNGVKAIGFAVTLILVAIIVFLLQKERNTLLAVSFVLSLCMIKVWNIRFSMEYQPAFILAFILCILYIAFEKKGDRYLLFFSTAGGAFIAFFDFLTTETMTILLPLIFTMTIRAKRNVKLSFIENLRFVIIQIMAWVSSYAMCFLTKWSMASLLTGENQFALAMQSVGNRVSGIMSEDSEISRWQQMLVAPAANISILLGSEKRIDGRLLILGTFLIVFFLSIGIYMCFRNKEKRSTTLILLLLGCVILFRYIFLSNHSYMHAFFTYRGMISLIMAIFSVYIVRLDLKEACE